MVKSIAILNINHHHYTENFCYKIEKIIRHDISSNTILVISSI